MLIKRNSKGSSPCYVYHKGLIKHQPSKQYVGGIIDYFDYVELKNLNLTDLKKMNLGNKWRLVSMEVEAHNIKKFIPKDRVVELYFEHLDSYIGIDDPIEFGCRTSLIPENEDVVGPVDKEFERENLYSGDDFEDSENEFSNDELMVDKQGHYKHSFEDGKELITDEIQKKILDGDSDNESFDFPKHNAKTDGKNPILVSQERYIQWKKNDKVRMKAKCIHNDYSWEIMA
ncbi:hypothetical protein R3W88_007862 [Solanum pinnatisectum]|uniref:Uncharacterized protein n=1 Tax=Solanum pinnatisectum TaxID=50273 RepID=A0AAV9M6E0_9SOLN|nr:hypothetical protein R3W88_007862 [Solanum pinnatisectum]